MKLENKVSTFSKRLSEALNIRNMSQAELSRKTGIWASAISDYINNKYEAKQDKIDILAAVLDVSPAWLMGFGNEMQRTNYKNMEIIGTLEPMDSYKYIDAKVAAGYPTPVEAQNYKEISIPRKFLGQYADNPNIIIMKTYGESMNKIIPSDSLIGILPFYSIFDIQNGDIVVFRDRDYDYAVKRFFKYEDKIVLRPESTDPRFTDIVYENTEGIEIIGKVIMYNVIL